MKCPICDSTMEHRVDAFDGGYVSEETEWCKNGCYHKQFAYGHTTVTIFNRKEFDFHYNDSKEQDEKEKIALTEEIAYWINDFKYLTRLMEDTKEHNIKIIENFGIGMLNTEGIAKFKGGIKIEKI